MTTLVTTELAHTWPVDDKVILLGEWCRPFGGIASRNASNLAMVPYHWDDRAKLRADFHYLQDLNTQLLEELAEAFAELHGTYKPASYWRQVLGYWLNVFTAATLDRWCMLAAASAQVPKLRSLILPRDDALAAAEDASTSIARACDDPVWNHGLYGELMKLQGCVTLSMVDALPSAAMAIPTPRQPVLIRLVKQLGALPMRAKGGDLVSLAQTYLPRSSEWRLEARYLQVPAFWSWPAPVAVAYDPRWRAWQLADRAEQTPFEKAVRRLLPKYIPRCFLEGFGAMREQVRHLALPRAPRLIWTSVFHFSSELFNYWAAEKRAAGARLVIGEHGGMGVGAFNGAHAHERAIADRYLSTGWSDAGDRRVVPVGNFRLTPRQTKWNPHGKALLVCGLMPRYSFDLRAMMISSQVLSYFEDLFGFVAALPEAIADELRVRLYRQDFGWKQAARWKSRFPNVDLDPCDRSIWSTVRHFRLFISTYNATTYIESLSLDLPTVMFWNPEHWEIKDSARPYFDALENAGIFHRTPRAAAAHVAKVWSDVAAWWRAPAVRQARDRFLEQYSARNSDVLNRIDAVLREEVALASAS